MNKHLKLFTNHSAYSQAESNIDKPNVVMCQQENEVHYNPDPYKGHDYVEIAGIKWATMNIGANNETDYGLYFQWADPQGYNSSQIGEGEGEKYFGEDDYEYDYYLHPEYSYDDIHPEHDGAIINWGGNWRMPTGEELYLLISNTDFTWETNFNNSGISGGKYTDKSDSSKYVFFPAGGEAIRGILHEPGSIGAYWSSSRGSYGPVNGTYLNIQDQNMRISYTGPRFQGYNIRPVAD